jgi:preprotein translocase subunit YajC
VVTAAQSSQGGGSILPLLLLVGVFALMYFLVIRPQSQRRKSMQSMQSAIEEGAPVLTLGGLYGTVVSSEGDSVVLLVSPGVTNRYSRAAIAKVLSDSDAIKAGLAPAADEVDEHEVIDHEVIDEADTVDPVETVEPAATVSETPIVVDPTAPAPVDSPEDSKERR